MHRRNYPLRNKIETQEVAIKKMQEEMTYLKIQLSKCFGIISSQNYSEHIEVSTPSTPLTLPEINKFWSI